MTDCATIGIDIGGTKTLIVLFDEKFGAIEEFKFKTRPDKGRKEFLQNLSDGISILLRKVKKRRLLLAGAGAGCSGKIDGRKGIFQESHNIPFLKGYPLAEHLAEMTGTEVLLANDVQMGLHGEHQLGAAAGLRHVLGIFFGTGIGGAIIIDGKLHVGASGAAGEIGHCLVSPMGPLTGSERQGVLDEFVSRQAIAGAAAAISARQWAPNLFKAAGADVTRIHSGTLADSIRAGDKKIEEMVRSRARMAGLALSNFVDFLSPEMVVLGGGLVEAMPELFLKEVGAGILEHTVPCVRKTTRVVLAALKGRAVAAGAAKMAWDRFKNGKPHPPSPGRPPASPRSAARKALRPR